MSDSTAFIGFPEGMLSEKPVRLPVLANRRDWFSVNKPAGLLGQAHPWYKALPNVTAALRAQIDLGKGELAKLGISGVHFVCGPEHEFCGPMLFAKNKNCADLLKNALGSNQLTFTYWFLSTEPIEEPELNCNLPVAPHQSKPQATISNKIGKKSSTRFRRLENGAGLQLWEAVSTLPRMHQIRIHALESGLPILGDPLYLASEQSFTAKTRNPDLRSLTRFQGLGLALMKVDISSVLPEIPPLVGRLANPFELLLRKSGFASAHRRCSTVVNCMI